MRRRPALLSWSSGKDSAHALEVIRRVGEYEVVGLVTTINSGFGRVAMQERSMQQAFEPACRAAEQLEDPADRTLAGIAEGIEPPL